MLSGQCDEATDALSKHDGALARAMVAGSSCTSRGLPDAPSPRGADWDPEEEVTDEHLLQAPECNASDLLGYTLGADAPCASSRSGIHNLGSTCFGSALLQASASLTMVRSWACGHGGLCQHERKDGCLLCLLVSDLLALSSPSSTLALVARRRLLG